MQDSVKVTLLVVTFLAMAGSWYFGIDPTLQDTFLGLFLAAVGWFSPVGGAIRAVGKALMNAVSK